MACEALTRSLDEGMTEPNEQYAYFTITGDFDPADISQQAGMPATEQWRKGDINPRTKLERKFSRWSLCSRLEKTVSLEAHMTDVIDQMKAHENNFICLSESFGGVMQLVAYFKCGYPGLHFKSAMIQSLSHFSLEVDLDFYYLYSDRREDSE